jgi:Fe-S cluster assembly protein SufB
VNFCLRPVAALPPPFGAEGQIMSDAQLDALVSRSYQHGFVTDIESESLPPGLDEDTVRAISRIKGEPQFLTDWRLKAFRHWLTLREPQWAHLRPYSVDFQALSYYSAPKAKTDGPKSLDEVDPKLLATYEKLGVPLHERARLAGVAVDAVFDSVSVATTFKDRLEKAGVIFCSFSDAVRKHPELIERYLGTVVPISDNFYACLNSAVFSDGSFVYVPKGVRCPMELSTYFRINAAKTGQFERTLIIADAGSHVSYLEGCTAPMRDENQLHAAVVELIAEDDATIKYSTVQNWYPGDENGVGGIYNFVTKRGECRGRNAHISWTQVETGSAITWKYPSCVLRGENSVGEFYSVALANHYQQADTGTKMIHIGANTRSTIVSKGISAGRGQNAYRGLVKILPSAHGARNYTQCDSLLMGDLCGAHTFPYVEVKNPTATVEHEASTSRISEDQLFYCLQRGIAEEDAVNMIVNGFCKSVFKELPMEFAVEAQNLLAVSLEGAVG